jgi:protocatechuate 3,4-dioxygenase beta subunit
LEKNIREELGAASLDLSASWKKRHKGIMSAVLATAVSWEGSAQGLGSVAAVATVGGSLFMKKVLLCAITAVLLGVGIFGSALLNREDVTLEPTALPAQPLNSTPSVSLPPSKPEEPRQSISSDPAIAVAQTAPEPVRPQLEKGELTDPSEHCTISGRVTDAQGLPIRGASVWVMASGDDEARGDPRMFAHSTASTKRHHFSTLTNFRGEYTVSGVRFAGTAMVWGAKKGYATGNARNSAFPGVMQRRFDLKPGDHLENVDLTLLAGIALEGRVLAADGTPVTDGSVVCRTAWNIPEVTHEWNAGIAHTDSRGYFHLGYLERVNRCNLQVFSATHGLFTFRNVSITEQEVVLRYEERAALRGIITHSDGSAAEGYTLRLHGTVQHPLPSGGNGLFPGSEHSALVDGQGQYEIEGVDPGQTYTAVVYGIDNSPASPKSNFFSISPAETKVWDYTLPGGVTIRGRVIGEKTGLPIPHMRVRCRKDGMPIQWHEGQENEVHVDEDGQFEFHFQTGAGEYTVTPLSALSGSYFDPGHQTYAKTVELEEGGEAIIDIECFAPVTLALLVTNPNGKPLKDVPLWVQQDVPEVGVLTNTRAGATDDTGRFSYSGFEPGVEAWFIVRNGESYVGAESYRYLGEPGQAIPVEPLVLYPHAGVEGRVTDAQGYPLADTFISIVARHDEGREARVSTGTGPEGFFSVTNGIPATWAVLEITVEDGSGSLRWISESVEFLADQIRDLGTIDLLRAEDSLEQE